VEPLGDPDLGGDGGDRRSFGARPLTARSVIASTLLGVHPPRLSSRLLVRSGELFGITEGSTRTALSRMVAAGELDPDDGAYRLAGPLLSRQARQDASRRADRQPWDGSWWLAVVVVERRPAATRAELRQAMRRLKMAELREGVWTRPANLGADRDPDAREVVTQQCRSFTTRSLDDAPALAGSLWDLDGWAATTGELRASLGRLQPALDDGDAGVLAEAFVVSATVLRHLLADPLLPLELLPDDWPGDALRADYERYDSAFKDVWRAWFRRQG
jgi:phenylacetic acid degradation operon negative regulatory protein